MKWSKFNYVYYSNNHKKYLLYNSLSNVFIDLGNQEVFQLLQKYKDQSANNLHTDNSDFHNQLIKSKILVESDDVEIMKIKNGTLFNRYSSNTIILTLLPTLACNFKCPYCFANEGDGSFMSDAVGDQIIKYVKNCIKYNKSSNLNLTWMGGEPLLNYKKIKELTLKIKELDIKLNASIVTNGYLMTQSKIENFKDLNIRNVQVTIDGLENEHNETRIHKRRNDSFAKIVNNLDAFFKVYNNRESVSINIRVNLDRTKDYISKFTSVYKFFKSRYPYENLFISPGFIENIKDNGLKKNCEFDRASLKRFFEEIVKSGLKEYTLYPKNQLSECAVRSMFNQVIGPNGELYSCWENIGSDEFVIGHLGENGLPIVSNDQSYYRYLTDADYLTDDKCLDCFFFPICNGGCPEKRIRNKHFDACFDNCAVQKDNIEDILDLHYEVKKSN